MVIDKNVILDELAHLIRYCRGLFIYNWIDMLDESYRDKLDYFEDYQGRSVDTDLLKRINDRKQPLEILTVENLEIDKKLEENLDEMQYKKVKDDLLTKYIALESQV